MKTYPSIEGIRARVRRGEMGGGCLAFFKYDGTNIRVEWSRKRGWYKFGTRKVLIDRDTEAWGPVIDLWGDQLADPVARVIRESYPKAESVIAFAEFFGPGSFSGQHVEGDPKELRLIDVSVHRKGFLSPRDFVRDFGHLERAARVVYDGPLDLEFVSRVRRGEMALGEGVVCKGGAGHSLWMAKVKTDAWIRRVKSQYPATWRAIHSDDDEAP